MLLRDLTRVWVSEYETINHYGEKSKKWHLKKVGLAVSDINTMSVEELNKIEVNKLIAKNRNDLIWLNIQQDINELDRKPTGEVDYSIEKARTNMEYDIQKGNGISLTDISKLENFVPDYIVTDKTKIGNTTLYKLEKNNGN
ncbi:MAG: hypothetical protein HFJ34_04800 [Clostridia bacterium]|nr:hypothetical protein [Clostridia bacterium]